MAFINSTVTIKKTIISIIILVCFARESGDVDFGCPLRKAQVEFTLYINHIKITYVCFLVSFFEFLCSVNYVIPKPLAEPESSSLSYKTKKVHFQVVNRNNLFGLVGKLSFRRACVKRVQFALRWSFWCQTALTLWRRKGHGRSAKVPYPGPKQ